MFGFLLLLDYSVGFFSELLLWVFCNFGACLGFDLIFNTPWTDGCRVYERLFGFRFACGLTSIFLNLISY